MSPDQLLIASANEESVRSSLPQHQPLPFPRKRQRLTNLGRLNGGLEPRDSAALRVSLHALPARELLGAEAKTPFPGKPRSGAFA